ncbi:MAG: phosphotransferase [Lachnospiraceae bacterium]|nr:phosphotransferase [Lachnospiraceae bacterium]
MDKKSLPQYIRVATRLASRIANGEVTEGERLAGLSVLSSSFNVSPETVRKALALLSDMGIVQLRENKRTVVLSAEKAASYLESVNVRQEQMDLSNELRALYKEYKQLGKQMVRISTELVAASATPLPTDQALPNYEVVIPGDSDKIGLSIGELRFWQCTGATIVAIKRGQNIMVSPGPYSHIHAGDVIVYVGAPSCKQAVEHLFSGGRPKTLYSMQETIFQAIHEKELMVIAKALGAHLGELTDFEPMVKGMTNRSFLFSCKDKRYILRIPGEGTGSLVNRRDEAAVYRAISGTGLCDDVVYINPENGLKVTRFLDRVRNLDPYDEEELVQGIRLLRQFHDMKLKVDHEFSIIEHINRYESFREGQPSAYPDYEETKRNVLSLEQYVTSHRGEKCLTHIDAVPDNFLFHVRDGKEELQLTDWEYAGMQDPHVDIAMFCIYSGYTKEQADHLMDLYFDGECNEDIRTKIYCYIAACGLLWSNWCEYKRLLGVEFGDYALSQYRYAKDFHALVKDRI